MGKKVKFKVKRGKLKVKLKTGDGALPLSETDIRGLLVLGMASAVGSGAGPDAPALLSGSETPPSPSSLALGDRTELDASLNRPDDAAIQNLAKD